MREEDGQVGKFIEKLLQIMSSLGLKNEDPLLTLKGLKDKKRKSF